MEIIFSFLPKIRISIIIYFHRYVTEPEPYYYNNRLVEAYSVFGHAYMRKIVDQADSVETEKCSQNKAKENKNTRDEEEIRKKTWTSGRGKAQIG